MKMVALVLSPDKFHLPKENVFCPSLSQCPIDLNVNTCFGMPEHFLKIVIATYYIPTQ
jgi:hypothetical protein